MQRVGPAGNGRCTGAASGLMRLLTIGMLVALGCAPEEATMERSVTSSPFGTTPAGESVELFTLVNPAGIEVRAMTYGGIIVSLRTPDRDGAFEDIVLGYDDLAGYIRETPYFGAIVGRYGNRIANGRFVLDGEAFSLARNNGPSHLHGGIVGFGAPMATRATRAIWTYA